MAGPELTPDLTGNPFVEVFFDPAELDPATASLRMYRFSDGRTWLVRGGVEVAPGVAAQDFEVPFQVESAYRAEMFDASGASLGFTESASLTVDYTGTVVHQPLVPSLWTSVTILNESAAEIVRPSEGELIRTEGAVAGRWMGAGRRGLENVFASLLTDGIPSANRLQGMLGDYTSQQVGVLCIRTSEAIRWPRTFFAHGDLVEIDYDVRLGGSAIQFDGQLSESVPPFPGLVTPLLTYDDLDAFGNYSVQDASWATYTDRDRAYELAGLAG